MYPMLIIEIWNYNVLYDICNYNLLCEIEIFLWIVVELFIVKYIENVLVGWLLKKRFERKGSANRQKKRIVKKFKIQIWFPNWKNATNGVKFWNSTVSVDHQNIYHKKQYSHVQITSIFFSILTHTYTNREFLLLAPTTTKHYP